jgi:hypothetical protein
MGQLKITAIRIDEDDLVKAKNLGINVSQVCRNAVKEAIRRMEGTSTSRDPGIYRNLYSDDENIRKIGFEGGRGTVGSRREGRRGDLNPTSWLH